MYMQSFNGVLVFCVPYKCRPLDCMRGDAAAAATTTHIVLMHCSKVRPLNKISVCVCVYKYFVHHKTLCFFQLYVYVSFSKDSHCFTAKRFVYTMTMGPPPSPHASESKLYKSASYNFWETTTSHIYRYI